MPARRPTRPLLPRRILVSRWQSAPRFPRAARGRRARWAAMKPTCASYYYDWSNYPAGGCPSQRNRDRLDGERSRNLASLRRTRRDQRDLDGGSEPDQSHQGGFPAATVEQMLAECREIAQMDPSLNDIVVVANDQGFPVRCSIRPHGYDACTRGVQVDSFNGAGSAGSDGPHGLLRPVHADKRLERLHLHRRSCPVFTKPRRVDGLRCQVVLDAQNVSVGRCATITLARFADGTPSGATRLGLAHVRPLTAPADLIVVPSSGIPAGIRPWRPISLTLARGDAGPLGSAAASLTVHTDRSAPISVPRRSIADRDSVQRMGRSVGFHASFVWGGGRRGRGGDIRRPAGSARLRRPGGASTLGDGDGSGPGPGALGAFVRRSNIDVARWGPWSRWSGNPACGTGAFSSVRRWCRAVNPASQSSSSLPAGGPPP